MLRLQHSSVLKYLPSLGLITVLALLCISSLTTASPVQPSNDVLLAKRAPIPGTVNSKPGPLLVANVPPDQANPPANPPTNVPSSPLAIPGARLPTIPSVSNIEMAQGMGPQIPVCEGKAPTDRSLYPTTAIADRFIGRSLEAVCRERDPGPNCMCLLNQRTLRVDLQCFQVNHFFPALDRDWHVSGVMQVCRSKCKCPHIPAEQIPPGSPRTPLGPRPASLGQRPAREPSTDLDSIV